MSFDIKLDPRLRAVWDRIIDAIGPVKLYSGYVMGRCPSHSDNSPSLEAKANDEGDRLLLKCQAGCDTGDVLRKLNISMWELFSNHTSRAGTVTLDTLADAKCLPAEWLYELGCKNVDN